MIIKVVILFNGVFYFDLNYVFVIYVNSVVNLVQDLGLQFFNLDGKSLVNLVNNVIYMVDINSNIYEVNLFVVVRMYILYGKVMVGDFMFVVMIIIVW